MEVIKLDVNIKELYTQMYGEEMAAKKLEAEQIAESIRKQIKDIGFDQHMEIWVDPDDFNYTEIEISGDWKHAHEYLDSIMNHLGWTFLDEEESEDESCGDWYKSVHMYEKSSNN